MPFATRLRLSHLYLLAGLAAFAGVASGCQSSRPSFAFQPAPSRAVAPAAPPAAMPFANPAAPTQLAAVPAGRPALRKRRTWQPVAGLAASPRQAVQAAAPAPAAVAPATRHRPWLRRPHATAESGLGLTVLGLLGMLTLVVALVGLLLSGGGLGWLVVAGVAAAAVLLAYLDPGGH